MHYFGSVKFYKHLIFSVIFLFLIIPYIISLYFVIQNARLKDKLVYFQDNKIDYINSYIESKNINNFIKNKVEDILVSETIPESVLNENLLTNNTSFSYQNKYNELYVERDEFVLLNDNDKVAYLTFDDGPSDVTWDVLNTLEDYGIYAAFFVTYKDDAESLEIYKEIVNRGHTLAIHSSSHNYKEIYNSVDDFLEDFNKLFVHIYNITGIKPKIFRFPGGSINPYNYNIYIQLHAEMLRRGFIFYDWNVSSGDADYSVTKDSIIKSVTESLEGKNKAIVLMHDSAKKKTTAATLSEVIELIKNKGYRFEKLDNTVYPITFSYTN
ncbi:MAG: polysaccharide deacetylase [Firmicutes bacterium]|jgi:peptidoglycan/xylan/chitin deacetylase (PgdA/CDA1 family)|nr:polysaccharide deacetylase [Bacillota bacterium]